LAGAWKVEAAADCKVIAPAAELPIEIAPLEVPVLIFVSKFEEAFKEIAPPLIVNPVWPVKSPAEVIVPVPVAEILPGVDIWSPLLTGDRVEVPESLLQNPTSELPVEEMLPEHVRFPVASSTVQPVEPEPPANKTLPLAPGFKEIVLEPVAGPAITGSDPAKVKAVEVKVLVLMVEVKVAAPAIDKVPASVVEMPPVVVIESPAVPGERTVPALVQKPIVPVEPPPIFPAQVKSPVVLLIVQPVSVDPPAISTSPVEVPAIITLPVVPAFKLILVPAVEAEIAGEAPAKVKAAEVKVLVLMVEENVTASVVVAPRPVMVAKVSASVPVTVIVVPAANTVLIPEPAIVKAPLKELTKETPPDASAQVGTPPTTVKTWSVVPILSLARVSDAEVYIMSPVVYDVKPVPP